MMLYALGALKRYTPVFGDKIKRVSMAIVQPRVTQDVKECEMTVDELLAWGENVVKPAAQKAFNGEGEFCAGAHCKFCRGRDVCPARAKLNTALEDLRIASRRIRRRIRSTPLHAKCWDCRPF